MAEQGDGVKPSRDRRAASRKTYAVFIPRDGGHAHARVSYDWNEASGFAKGVPGAHVRKFAHEQAARSWLQYMHGADAEGPVPQSKATAAARRIERQPRAPVASLSFRSKRTRARSSQQLPSAACPAAARGGHGSGGALDEGESVTGGHKRRRSSAAAAAPARDKGPGADAEDEGRGEVVLLTVSTDGACKMRSRKPSAAAAGLAGPCPRRDGHGNKGAPARKQFAVASWAVVWHDLDERAGVLMDGKTSCAAAREVLRTRAALLTDTEEHTNQRAELRAFVQALRDARDLQQRCDPGTRVRLRVRTDSMWTINGYSDWLRRWRKNGWRKADGGAVKHQDLWAEADEIGGQLRGGVEMLHVRGHRGDFYNEMADALATKAIASVYG